MARKKEEANLWLYNHVMQNDGRKKLLKCQEERIQELHKAGYAYDAIRVFFLGRISKSRIYYVIHPDKYKSNTNFSNILQAKRKYRTKEKRAETNKKYRDKKKRGSELLEGKLFDNH